MIFKSNPRCTKKKKDLGEYTGMMAATFNHVKRHCRYKANLKGDQQRQRVNMEQCTKS